MHPTRRIILAGSILAGVALTACVKQPADPKTGAGAPDARIKAIEDAQARVQAHLARFEQLDYEAFSKQNWDLFSEIHCDNVRVVYPDGHETVGIDKHRGDIAVMFAATPDMRVSQHPVVLGSGEWTAVTGVLEATFTQPMKVGDKTIEPTGRKLKLPMVTFARWKDGCIAEEQLFWDNAAYARQLGIGG